MVKTQTCFNVTCQTQFPTQFETGVKQTDINHCVAARYEMMLNMLLLYVGAPGLEMAHRLSKQIEAAGKHVMICHDYVMTVLNLYQTLSRTGHPCCEHL